ncbi:MAG: beta-N-acetylhexosaminidase [Oscillospiraceae bacterium]|nr:beta-N-acetylhexosaminidase [Oscillospiraceae bacterium]
MSQSNKNDTKKKKRRRGKKSALEKVLLGSAFCAAVLLACFAVYIMSLGTGVPSTGVGEVATRLEAQEESTQSPTTEPPTTEPPTTEPPTTEPPTTEPTEPPLPAHVEMAMALMEELTLEEKLWQMIFLTPDELTETTGPTIAGEGTRAAMETYPVGGMVYFGEHIIGKDQITTMLANTGSYAKIPPFLCVDEEGGYVSRLSKIGVVPRTDPMEAYGAAGDEQAVYDLGADFAEKIASVGFNLDFAPVADVITNPYNTEIDTRSFSDDPEVAARMVAQMVKGLQDGNMIACLKHFPGHGSTSIDSHYGKSVSERTAEELRATEFIPFKAGIEAGVELVMISHMSLPNVTGNEEPCDFSYDVVTGMLRQELGFEGLIITDSHEMGSISYFYDCGEAALKAVQAGCDVVLMPTSKTDAFETLLAVVQDGTLTEERINESVLRILSLKCKYGIITESSD